MKNRFTLSELITISVLCAIGLAIKPIINPLVHVISGILRIPGGSLSGGFVMMWMALARVIINKRGVALVFGIAQGLAVMLLGFFGSHGVFSIVSYSMPGLMMEIFAFFFRGRSLPVLCLYTIVANITGTAIVAIVVMQVPFLLLMITIISATISGLLGGFLADLVLQKLEKYKIISIR